MRVPLTALAFSAGLLLSIPSQADTSSAEPTFVAAQEKSSALSGDEASAPQHQPTSQVSEGAPTTPALETGEQIAALTSEPTEAVIPGESAVVQLEPALAAAARELPIDVPTTGALADPVGPGTEGGQALAQAQPAPDSEQADLLALATEPPVVADSEPSQALADQNTPALERSEEPSLPLL